MTPKEVAELLESCAEGEAEIIRLEPAAFHDRFILGLVERFGMEPVLCYDLDGLRQAYVEEEGLSFEEACEHLSYNTLGAWLGEGTPAFLSRSPL